MDHNFTNNFNVEQQDSPENNESAQTLKPCCCYRLVLSRVESLLANGELADLRLMEILERLEKAVDRRDWELMRMIRAVREIKDAMLVALDAQTQLFNAYRTELLSKHILEACDRHNGERTAQ